MDTTLAYLAFYLGEKLQNIIIYKFPTNIVLKYFIEIILIVFFNNSIKSNLTLAVVNMPLKWLKEFYT